MSATSVDTLPPRPAPVFKPSTCMRPSLLRPPAPPNTVIDIQGIRRQATVSSEVLTTIPTARSWAATALLIPGIVMIGGDDWGCNRHREGLGHSADRHLSIDLGRERSGELDPVSLHLREAWQRNVTL
jgi:hypothetical protein